MGKRSRSSSTLRSSSRSKSRSRSASRDRRRRSRSNSRSTYSRSPSPNNYKRLHVANLDETVRRRDIEDTFGKYGKLTDVWVATYPPFYAFVVFEKSSEANDALKDMRSGYIRNCHVRTSIALPRQIARRAPPPRRYYNDRYNDRDRFRRRSRSRSPRRHKRSSSRSPKRVTRRDRTMSRSVSR